MNKRLLFTALGIMLGIVAIVLSGSMVPENYLPRLGFGTSANPVQVGDLKPEASYYFTYDNKPEGDGWKSTVAALDENTMLYVVSRYNVPIWVRTFSTGVCYHNVWGDFHVESYYLGVTLQLDIVEGCK